MTRLIAFALALACSFLALAPSASAQFYEKVYDFFDARVVGSVNKGNFPSAPLVQDKDGNFYGVTARGGANDLGTIFKMTPDGVLTTLVEFTGDGTSNKGSLPVGGLVQGGDGNFYGTTESGGLGSDPEVFMSGLGTIFRMTPDGVLTTLVEFTGNGSSNKGTAPHGALIQGRDGNFYGTTSDGGANLAGTVFKMTPAGVLTTLVEFNYDNGAYPDAALVQGSDGNFYGTTREGGSEFSGTVFKMTPAGSLTTLIEFNDSNGAYPAAALVQGSDGKFYGTTREGGAAGHGTLFRMASSGAMTTLVEFTGNGASNTGAYPSAALLQASDGNFYGTTSAGGSSTEGSNPFTGAGTIFRMTAAGVLTTLVEFDRYAGNTTPNNGTDPSAALVQGSDGKLYGTTSQGGSHNLGTVFRMTTAGSLTSLLQFSPVGSAPTSFPKGSSPDSGLVQDSHGNFYGTTTGGGTGQRGTVYQMTPAGVLTTVVNFNGENGAYPSAELLQDGDGDFYGTTGQGGANDLGTIFKLTPDGVLTTLAEFTGNGASNKGAFPSAALVKGSDGNFYGTTLTGGANDLGTIFKLTPDGVLTTLVELTGNGASNKGANPSAALLLGSDGDFYGVTGKGGANNFGTIFKMTPAGVLTTLVEFTGNGASNKGYGPLGLMQGTSGNFFGVTARGGANDLGTVFKMTPAGVLTTLAEFTGNGASNKGAYPSAALLKGSDGNLYGTTQSGGIGFDPGNLRLGNGTIFKITPAGALTTLWQFLGSSDGIFPTGNLIAAADGNFYGITGSDGTIYRLIFSGQPTIAGANATLQGSEDALVEAQVNARGASTSVSLEYGTDGVAFPNSVPLAVGLSGFQTRLFGTLLTGLPSGAIYFYRFRAVSASGTTLSPVQSFSTLAAPEVSTLPASEVAPTSARFHGTVNAHNFETTVFFEWGTDGNRFPNVVAAEPALVSGNQPVAVAAAVAGLPQGGTVFFRIRATNAAGTVTTGARGFNTGLGVTTSALNDADVGVTDVVFRATINTFGQAASVKFKYWADSAPGEVLETATQTVTSSGPVEVSARVTGLAENTSYSYRVSVELAGTETEGDAVAFATETNAAPVAANDLVFYAGQVVVDPLANDTDPNDGTSASLMLDPVLVVPPNASLGVASVTSDRRFISYNPQFNVRDDDSLTYRVVDPLGASAQAEVRLIAFSKRAGLYGGKIVFGSGATGREGQVAVQMGGGGAISTSFMNWPNATEHLGESFVLKGVFDQRGRFSRTLNSPSGAVLTLSLQLDADLPQMHGVFEERVNGASTTGEIAFTLILNAGTGGLAGSGLRTGFLSPPSELASVMANGFVRMTVGKDAKRGARFAGRLPDGEPFLASAKAQGRTYELTRKLEQGGLFTGLVRALDGSTGASGMMGDLYWQKRANSRAKFYRGGVETMLSLSGAAYPALGKNELPPIGLGTANPNARLRLSGGDLPGAYRDLLLNILPGGVVQIVGSDPMQTGADIPTNKLQVKVDAPKAAFAGRFLHPATGKAVTFEGAFRVPFDEEPGQGRGVFRGPNAAGGVQVLIP